MWSTKPKIFTVILQNKFTYLKVTSFLSNLFQTQCDIVNYELFSVFQIMNLYLLCLNKEGFFFFFK